MSSKLDPEIGKTGMLQEEGGLKAGTYNFLLRKNTVLEGRPKVFDKGNTYAVFDGDHMNEMANLMLAAPDLLAALMALVADYSWSDDNLNGGYASEHPITAAKAAIAKATGQEVTA